MADWLWELANPVKSGSANNWDLLNKRIGGEKDRVLLGPVLNELLVFVEFLQVVETSDLDVDTSSGALVSVLLIGDEADLQLWTRDVGKSDGTNETLILGWVIILQGDLELDGLLELSGLSSDLLLELGDALKHFGIGNFRNHGKY